MRNIALVLAPLLLATRVASAQSVLTTNTLRLDDPARQPRASFADVRLLIGHWRGRFLGATAEELWLQPEGGAMVGLFRLFDDDGVRFYEIMQLVEDRGGVTLRVKHFRADLSAWEERDASVSFPLVRFDAQALWFDGLTIRREGEDKLRGFLATQHKDGTIVEQGFVLKRVRRP